MKKLLKKVLALSLCASVITPFSSVLADKPDKSIQSIDSDDEDFVPESPIEDEDYEEARIEENKRAFRNFIINSNAFSDWSNLYSERAQADFEACPELKTLFDVKIWVFRHLFSRLSRHMKNFLKDWIIDFCISVRELKNNSESIDIRNIAREKLDALDLGNEEREDIVFNFISYFIEEIAFDNYPSVSSFFVIKCMKTIIHG